MNLYVKSDKFGYDCGYLTEGEVYKVNEVFIDGRVVEIASDNNSEIFLVLNHTGHTDSQWYFCDEQGNRLEDN